MGWKSWRKEPKKEKCQEVCFAGNQEDSGKLRDKLFIENGSRLLEETIRSCNRNHSPIRTFSLSELEEATNNFNQDQICVWQDFSKLYKGWHDGRYISVKRFNVDRLFSTDTLIEKSINEMVIAAQMSNHRHILRFLGCCLETEVPMLVYESAGKQLSNYIFEYKLSWERMLRVAVDIANAIAYLHMSQSNPIIHRDINAHNVCLDQNYVAKWMLRCLAEDLEKRPTMIEVAKELRRISDVHPTAISNSISSTS